MLITSTSNHNCSLNTISNNKQLEHVDDANNSPSSFHQSMEDANGGLFVNDQENISSLSARVDSTIDMARRMFRSCSDYISSKQATVVASRESRLSAWRKRHASTLFGLLPKVNLRMRRLMDENRRLLKRARSPKTSPFKFHHRRASDIQAPDNRERNWPGCKLSKSDPVMPLSAHANDKIAHLESVTYALKQIKQNGTKPFLEDRKQSLNRTTDSCAQPEDHAVSRDRLGVNSHCTTCSNEVLDDVLKETLYYSPVDGVSLRSVPETETAAQNTEMNSIDRPLTPESKSAPCQKDTVHGISTVWCAMHSDAVLQCPSTNKSTLLSKSFSETVLRVSRIELPMRAQTSTESLNVRVNNSTATPLAKKYSDLSYEFCQREKRLDINKNSNQTIRSKSEAIKGSRVSSGSIYLTTTRPECYEKWEMLNTVANSVVSKQSQKAMDVIVTDTSKQAKSASPTKPPRKTKCTTHVPRGTRVTKLVQQFERADQRKISSSESSEIETQCMVTNLIEKEGELLVSPCDIDQDGTLMVTSSESTDMMIQNATNSADTVEVVPTHSSINIIAPSTSNPSGIAEVANNETPQSSYDVNGNKCIINVHTCSKTTLPECTVQRCTSANKVCDISSEQCINGPTKCNGSTENNSAYDLAGYACLQSVMLDVVAIKAMLNDLNDELDDTCGSTPKNCSVPEEAIGYCTGTDHILDGQNKIRTAKVTPWNHSSNNASILNSISAETFVLCPRDLPSTELLKEEVDSEHLSIGTVDERHSHQATRSKNESAEHFDATLPTETTIAVDKNPRTPTVATDLPNAPLVDSPRQAFSTEDELSSSAERWHRSPYRNNAPLRRCLRRTLQQRLQTQLLTDSDVSQTRNLLAVEICGAQCKSPLPLPRKPQRSSPEQLVMDYSNEFKIDQQTMDDYSQPTICLHPAADCDTTIGKIGNLQGSVASIDEKRTASVTSELSSFKDTATDPRNNKADTRNSCVDSLPQEGDCFTHMLAGVVPNDRRNRKRFRLKTSLKL